MTRNLAENSPTTCVEGHPGVTFRFSASFGSLFGDSNNSDVFKLRICVGGQLSAISDWENSSSFRGGCADVIGLGLESSLDDSEGSTFSNFKFCLGSTLVKNNYIKIYCKKIRRIFTL